MVPTILPPQTQNLPNQEHLQSYTHANERIPQRPHRAPLLNSPQSSSPQVMYDVSTLGGPTLRLGIKTD
eukprot:CAMPEP_0184721974 /NCGR_PEP_ID=MMETSP0314-20130426/20567_1 /TAXON_ID=38298 /ORGANISM="Rhodella maculata, Strain CCMP 736" /LENGTH=68 /DNA_ID=CAMNT_0027186443 /DNA_START=470 /DNA_END=676 /DNA_ORIENTATION=-